MQVIRSFLLAVLDVRLVALRRVVGFRAFDVGFLLYGRVYFARTLDALAHFLTAAENILCHFFPLPLTRLPFNCLLMHI